jgi:hypothetical protein
MIVSLSDEASGDFADANVSPPYKPEMKAPRDARPRRASNKEVWGCI